MNVTPILACAACNGDPNSPMTAGTWWGILVLIGVIVSVLGGFGGLFLFWMRRAKALERELAATRALAPADPDEPSVDEAPVWRTEDAAGSASPSVH